MSSYFGALVSPFVAPFANALSATEQHSKQQMFEPAPVLGELQGLLQDGHLERASDLLRDVLIIKTAGTTLQPALIELKKVIDDEMDAPRRERGSLADKFRQLALENGDVAEELDAIIASIDDDNELDMAKDKIDTLHDEASSASLRSKLQSLRAQVMKLDADSYKEGDQEIFHILAQRVHALSLQHTGFMPSAMQVVSNYFEQLLRTCPDCIQKAKKICEDWHSRELKSFEKAELSKALAALIPLLTETEKMQLRLRIQSLDNAEELDVHEYQSWLRSFLEEQEGKSTGPLAQNINVFGNVGRNLLQDGLQLIQKQFFDSGNPRRLAIEECCCWLSNTVVQECPPYLVRVCYAKIVKLARTLNANDHHSLTMEGKLSRLNALILSQATDTRSPSLLLCEMHEALASLLEEYPPSGVIAQSRAYLKWVWDIEKERRLQVDEALFPAQNFSSGSLSSSLLSIEFDAEDFGSGLRASTPISPHPNLATLPDPTGIYLRQMYEIEVIGAANGIRPILEGWSLKTLSSRIYNKVADAICLPILNHLTQESIPKLLSWIEQQFTAKHLNIQPIEHFRGSLRQLMIDVNAYKASPTSLSRSSALKKIRDQREGGLFSTLRTNFHTHTPIARFLAENARLEWAVTTFLTAVSIPYVSQPLSSLISTLMVPINWVARKMIFIGLRALFALVPSKGISEKFLDHFLSQNNLEVLYNQALHNLLELYQSPQPASDSPAESGARVQKQVCKELTYALFDLTKNHAGIHPDDLGRSTLDHIPQEVKIRLWDLGAQNIAYLYDNVLSPPQYNKAKKELFTWLHAKIKQNESPTTSTPSTAFAFQSIEELEQKLCELIANDILSVQKSAQDQHMVDVEYHLLALQQEESIDNQKEKLKTLQRVLENLLSNSSSPYRSRDLTNLTQLVKEALRKRDIEFAGAVRKIVSAPLGKSSGSAIPFHNDPIMIGFVREALKTMLIIGREVATDRELLKRIIFDQVFYKSS